MLHPQVFKALCASLLAAGSLKLLPRVDLFCNPQGDNSLCEEYKHVGNGVGTRDFLLDPQECYWANPPYTEEAVLGLLQAVQAQRPGGIVMIIPAYISSGEKVHRAIKAMPYLHKAKSFATGSDLFSRPSLGSREAGFATRWPVDVFHACARNPFE